MISYWFRKFSESVASFLSSRAANLAEAPGEVSAREKVKIMPIVVLNILGNIIERAM